MKEMKLNFTKEKIERGLEIEKAITADNKPAFFETLYNDWLTLHAAHEKDVKLIEKLGDALKSLNNSMPESEIDLCREGMGNTNVNVVLHWKGEAVKALADYTAWRGEK